MQYLVTGLSPAPFAALSALDDDALAARGIRRMIVDSVPGFPCRISLSDAPMGASVLLLSYEHQPANSPYRAQGPIFITEGLAEAAVFHDQVPAVMASRLLSVRAYDGDDLIVDADVVEGKHADTLFRRMLASENVAYLHVHYARRGCYAGRVERV